MTTTPHVITPARMNLASLALHEITAQAQLLRSLLDVIPVSTLAGLCGPAICARLQTLSELVNSITDPDCGSDTDEELAAVVHATMPQIGEGGISSG